MQCLACTRTPASRRRSRTVSITDATGATTATAVSSRMKMAATAWPGPLALGASDPSRPRAVTQATTLMTVVQTQPRASMERPNGGGDLWVGLSDRRLPVIAHDG